VFSLRIFAIWIDDNCKIDLKRKELHHCPWYY